MHGDVDHRVADVAFDNGNIGDAQVRHLEVAENGVLELLRRIELYGVVPGRIAEGTDALHHHPAITDVIELDNRGGAGDQRDHVARSRRGYVQPRRLVDGLGNRSRDIRRRVVRVEQDSLGVGNTQAVAGVELEGHQVAAVADRERHLIGNLRDVVDADFSHTLGQVDHLEGVRLNPLRFGEDLVDVVGTGEQSDEFIVSGFVDIECGRIVFHGDRGGFHDSVGSVAVQSMHSVSVKIQEDGHAGQPRFGFDGHTGDRIDSEGISFDLQEIGKRFQAVRTHQAKEIRPISRVEADLGTQSAEPAGTRYVARGPVHGIVIEDHDIAVRVVLDVEREGISSVRVVGVGALEVAHVDPVDLDERIAAETGSGRHFNFAAGRAGRVGPGVRVGPEGGHDGGDLLGEGRETLGDESAQGIIESDVAVVVDVELRICFAEELELES